MIRIKKCDDLKCLWKGIVYVHDDACPYILLNIYLETITACVFRFDKHTWSVVRNSNIATILEAIPNVIYSGTATDNQ